MVIDDITVRFYDVTVRLYDVTARLDDVTARLDDVIARLRQNQKRCVQEKCYRPLLRGSHVI